MTQTQSMQAIQTLDRTLQMVPTPPDAAHIVAQALVYCAQKLQADDPGRIVDRLRQHDSVACAYCTYSIAKQVAVSLGTLDENVQAVYTLEYDATPHDLCFAQASSAAPMAHLIAHVSRKTAALNALVEALDRSLCQALADVLDQQNLKTILDVQVVSDIEIQNRTGYGALFSSIHNRPIQVWNR